MHQTDKYKIGMKACCCVGTFALSMLSAVGVATSAEPSDDFFREGRRVFILGAYDEAARWLDRAIDSGFREKGVYRCRGCARVLCGRPREAVADFTAAIGLDARDGGLYYGRGVARYFLADFRGASQDLLEALRWYPEYWAASAMRSTVLLASGDIIGASQENRRAEGIERRSTTLTAETSFGSGRKMIVFRDEGPIAFGGLLAYETWTAVYNEYRENAQLLVGLRASTPNEGKLIYAQALRAAADGDLNRSLGAFSANIALAPENWKAYRMRGAVWILKNGLTEAIADLNKAIALNKSDLVSHNLRFLVYDELGQHDKSMADLTKSIAILQEREEELREREKRYWNSRRGSGSEFKAP